jgi:hypothetical protein
MNKTACAAAIAACFGASAANAWAQSDPRSLVFTASADTIHLAERTLDSRNAARRTRSLQVLTGPGTTVAVIDTGARATHGDLVNRIAPGSYSVITGTSDASDTHGHGTLVASIVAAQRDPNGGYDPRILPVKIFAGATTTDTYLSAGLSYAMGRAPIVNLSLSSSSPVAETALRNSVGAGQLVIIAAGNNGLANPEWPARYAKEGWANGQLIAVGAVDSNNVIASFSNRAGDTLNNFVVAPGVNIVGASHLSDTGQAVASGTSVAAPRVSGIAAIVKSYWPQLSAQQVAGVLLATAQDLGDPGVDAVYGRGLVTLDRALAPAGITMIPTAAGGAVAVSTASLDPGPVAGAALRTAATSGRLRGVGLDMFGRQFYYDFGAGVAPAPRFGIERMFGGVDRQFQYAERTFGNGARLVYATEIALVGQARGALGDYDQRARSNDALAGFALVAPLSERTELALGSLGLAQTYFGLAGAPEIGAQLVAPALANPLFTFAPAHHHIGLGRELGAGIKLKAGVLTTSGNQALLGQFGLAERPTAQANVALIEASRTFGRAFFAITGAQLNETASYLGSYSAEAFAIGARPAMTAITLQAAYSITPRLALAAQYTSASTPAFDNPAASLVTNVGASRADAFAMGLVKSETWQRGDRLALTVSQPLRASAGNMTFDLPTDVDATGKVLRTRETVSLQPSGREVMTEVNYSMPVAKRASLTFAAIHRHNPNHDATAPADRIFAVRFGTSF